MYNMLNGYYFNDVILKYKIHHTHFTIIKLLHCKHTYFRTKRNFPLFHIGHHHTKNWISSNAQNDVANVAQTALSKQPFFNYAFLIESAKSESIGINEETISGRLSGTVMCAPWAGSYHLWTITTVRPPPHSGFHIKQRNRRNGLIWSSDSSLYRCRVGNAFLNFENRWECDEPVGSSRMVRRFGRFVLNRSND